MELGSVLRCLSPMRPHYHVVSLRSLSLQAAAVHVMCALYELQRKQGASLVTDSAAWVEIVQMLERHVFSNIPFHLYEDFLDKILDAFDVAIEFDHYGKQMLQGVAFFFPKQLRHFTARRYSDRLMVSIVCCISKCPMLEELYLDKADSMVITTYFLRHMLKILNNIRVLALPRQSDDDVAAVIGQNCQKLEAIVLSGTNVTNVGIAWLLCCRDLHTIVMPGTEVTPKGVALLLHGPLNLRVLVYDMIGDVLTYVDFNTGNNVKPSFELRTVVFHSIELLSRHHLELVTKVCPKVEWLCLDSAFEFKLDGLGDLPSLCLLQINYKCRSIDTTMVEFFKRNGSTLTTLHFFEVKSITLEELETIFESTRRLTNLVFYDCSFAEQWNIHRTCEVENVKNLQIFKTSILPHTMVYLLSRFVSLSSLEMDVCQLSPAQMKLILDAQSQLQTVRCLEWRNVTAAQVARFQAAFPDRDLILSRRYMAADNRTRRNRSPSILARYAQLSPLLEMESVFAVER